MNYDIQKKILGIYHFIKNNGLYRRDVMIMSPKINVIVIIA